MKYNFKYILFLLISISILACSKKFLDRNPLDSLSGNTFWKTQADADLALAAVYSFLSPGLNATAVGQTAPGWGGLFMHWDILTDNAFSQSSGGAFAEISRGGVIHPSFGGIQSDGYVTPYKAIAACNNFLANIGRVPMDSVIKRRYAAEVRFIRAHYYHILTSLYGDVVLTLTPLGVDKASATLPRTPKAQVVNAIIADLDYAADNLPNTAYTNGHVVRGSALGYKARVLLANYRYAEAAAAAKTVITEAKFSLSNNFRNLFLKPGQNGNPEIMFSARHLPPNFSGTTDWVYSYTNSAQVLRSLVDEFDAIDGLPISQSPLYNPANPYNNRDPRLRYTIIAPGMWRGTTAATAFDPVRDNVPSGFLPRKYIDSTRYPTTYATQSDQDFVFLRYADVLMMYAEAQNEAVGPDASVHQYVNMVRARPGVNMPPLPLGLTQAEMRTRIQHERRVEFALEGTRYFDLKRWRLDRVIMPTVRDPSGALRTFPLRDTLWPVPQSEVDIATGLGNTGFKQTPGH